MPLCSWTLVLPQFEMTQLKNTVAAKEKALAQAQASVEASAAQSAAAQAAKVCAILRTVKGTAKCAAYGSVDRGP